MAEGLEDHTDKEPSNGSTIDFKWFA